MIAIHTLGMRFSTDMILVTLIVFLIGFAIGWRQARIWGLSVIIVLIFAFVALDIAVDSLVIWSNKMWLIVDLIAIQVGYLVGITFNFSFSDRRDRKRRGPDQN